MMKRIILFLVICGLAITSHGQQFPLDTLLYNGAAETRVNFVIVGDGYLESQQANFRADAIKITEDLFATPPFAGYEIYFNVFMISVPSNVEGAAEDPSALIDNYFGSTFNYGGIERLLVPTRTDKILNVMDDNFPAFDQVMVIVNSTKYGGSGGQFATSSINSAASEISIHEIGHSFAGLADEYWAGAQYARERPNMTQQSTNSRVTWRNWVGDFGVGIYPHRDNPTWFKPHQNCKMGVLEVPFCAVCRQAFVQAFYLMTPIIDGYSPTAPSDTNDSNVFTVDTKTVEPNTLRAYWLLDDDTVAKDVSIYELDASTLSDGPHELTFNVADLTPFLRTYHVTIDHVSWSLTVNNGTATYSSEQGQKAINRGLFPGGLVTSIDNEFVAEIGLTTAPNPVVDQLNISFYNPRTAPISLTLLDLNGKAFMTEARALVEQGDQAFTIDTSSLKHGMFLLQLVIGNKWVVKKILK